MAFFDTLGSMAKSTVETAKLDSKISAEKSLIDNVYKKIGEYYYGQYKSGTKLPEETAALCAEIDGHNSAIDEAKAEIERIKAQNTAAQAPVSIPAGEGIACNACGTANAPDKKFCQNCGAKLEAKQKESSEERVCACGAIVPPDAKFCVECGAKFESTNKNKKE